MIGHLVEAAGDLVEEGRDLLDFRDDLPVGGVHADPGQHAREGLAGGDALQHPAVQAIGGGQFRGDRLADLLLDLGLVAVELALELAHADGARAGGDHRIADLRVEEIAVSDPEHRKADDEETEQEGGDPGFRESANGGDH